MRVAVVGLWHLGSVTAVCLAADGHDVVAYDPDPAAVRRLRDGGLPVAEPGLAELLASALASDRLRCASDAATALAGADVVWIAFDTPIDGEDRADVGAVVRRVEALYAHVPAGSLVLVSSQLPVGTTARLEASYRDVFPGRPVGFAALPENLRLGRAVETFRSPDRYVVGLRPFRAAESRAAVEALLAPYAAPDAAKRVPIEWMSAESAELVKHGLNAFLATSVSFANELAALGERCGADARDVERGLKSDRRIGPGAYLRPGPAFGGGTLARDVRYLIGVADRVGQPAHLLGGVLASNDAHRAWTRRSLLDLLGEVAGRTVAVWGLAYKPGTSAVRRSEAVELVRWLAESGASVRVHDPAAESLEGCLAEPAASRVRRLEDPLEAADRADALVVAVGWPVYREIDVARLLGRLRHPIVIDAEGILRAAIGSGSAIRYATVGWRRDEEATK